MSFLLPAERCLLTVFGAVRRRLSRGLLFATFVLRDSLRQLVTRTLILIAGFGETNRSLRIGEDSRNNRLQLVINQRVQAVPARERQVQMVL